MSYVCPNVAIAIAPSGVELIAADLVRAAGAVVVAVPYAAVWTTRLAVAEIRQAVQRTNARLAITALMDRGYQFRSAVEGGAVFAKNLGDSESVATVSLVADSSQVLIDVDLAQGEPRLLRQCTEESFTLARAMQTPDWTSFRDQGWDRVLIAHRRERLPVVEPAANPALSGVVMGRVNTSLNRTFADVFGVPVLERQPEMVVVR